MKKIIIKNGQLVTPREIKSGDILVSGDKIQAIGRDLQAERAEVVDASGKYVFPGFIDAHTHMGVPIRGTTSADDFDSGSQAALHGGVTTIIDFTIHGPDQSLMDSIRQRKAEANKKSSVDYALHCNITHVNADILSEIPQVIREGIISFKVFTAYRDAGMHLGDSDILDILWDVKRHHGTVMFHAENGDLIDFLTRKYVRYNKTTAVYHAYSRPPEAEIEAVARVSTLNRYIHCPIYFVHLSTREAVQIAAMARQAQQPVFLETCPQYLYFDQSVYDRPDGHRFIAAPAFRNNSDFDALWQALQQGVIDVVGTDHCPFTLEQKDRAQGAFQHTPNGLPGVETLFQILYSKGVKKKKLSLQRLVSLIAEEPARLFALFPRKGVLMQGADADIVIFDPEGQSNLQLKDLHSATDWNPYTGMETHGTIESVLLRGEWLKKDNQIREESLRKGQFIPAIL